MRYWFDGPNKGKVEPVIDSLPGYPDNINRASDGNYWLALVGMRSPAVDLAFRMPSFRKRMSRRVAQDEWLYPNINTGCVVKFDEQGNILDALWDLKGINHPMITSMREHKEASIWAASPTTASDDTACRRGSGLARVPRLLGQPK